MQLDSIASYVVYNYLLDCIAHSFIDNLHIKVELRVVAWLGLVEHEDRGLENLNDFDYNWLFIIGNYSYSCFISDDVTFGVCFLVKDKHKLYFVSVVK